MGNTYLTQYLAWPNSNEGWKRLGTKFENKQPLAMIKNFTARIVNVIALPLFLKNWNGWLLNPCSSSGIAFWFLSVKGDWPLTILLRSSKRGLKSTIDKRNKNKMNFPWYKMVVGQRTCHYWTVSLWNSLPERLTELKKSLASFKEKLINYI